MPVVSFVPSLCVKETICKEDVCVHLVMIEQPKVFHNGVTKQINMRKITVAFNFNKHDWYTLPYKYDLNKPFSPSMSFAVHALIIQTAAAAAATSTPATAPVATSTPTDATPPPPTTTPSPPPPTPKCYIVCTCDESDCHLRQQQLQQHNRKRKRSSATLCAPYIKRKCD